MAIAKPGSSRPGKKTSGPRNKTWPPGLRPVRVWVPDLTIRGFRAEAHRQSLAVAASPQAREDQAFIDAISVSAE